MPLIIISYKKNWEETWRGRTEDSGDSSLELKSFEFPVDLDSVVNYLSNRIFSDDKATYANILLESHEDLEKTCEVYDDYYSDEGAESIRFHDHYEYTFNGENPERKALVEYLRKEVGQNLDRLRKEKDDNERKAYEAKRAKEEADKLEYERRKFEELKKKFGEQ